MTYCCCSSIFHGHIEYNSEKIRLESQYTTSSIQFLFVFVLYLNITAMVLTPRFDLSQSENEITINIYAPYARIKDTEIDVDGDVFYFYAEPYLLRLKLPGEIVENDSSSATYDCETRTFVLKFDKLNKGEHFKDLDMITTLLAPSKKVKNITPTIEVIENRATTDGDDTKLSQEDDDDWSIPQSLSTGDEIILPNAPKYGFANKISGVLGAFDAGLLKGVVNLPNPDTTPMAERKIHREADELRNFSDDHYIEDMIEIEENIKPLMEFIPEWYCLTRNNITFTDREKDILKELPNKEYLLDDDEIQTIVFGMVDILFGNCYTHRISKGENTVESSWDINTISSTLSWFENFSNMEEVIVTAMKRSLCYPQHRNWELSEKIFQDVKQIMKLGKKYILKRFCEIYGLFNNSFEPRYLLNQLYIRDYLIYIQQAPDSLFESIADTLEGIKPTKENMNLHLDELEVAAWSVLEEEKLHTIQNNLTTSSSKYKNNLCPDYFVNKIFDKMEKLKLDDAKVSLSCDTESDISSSNSSGSTTTSSSSSSSTSSSSSSDSCDSTDNDSETDSTTKSKSDNKQLDSDDTDDDSTD